MLGRAHRWILGSTLIFAAAGAVACSASSTKREIEPASDKGTRFDHVVIFAADAELEECLQQALTLAEALTTRHEGQGTVGHYYLFLDNYVEVLTQVDAAEARGNVGAFGSNYLARWTDAADVSPFGVGVIVASLAPEAAPFPARVYTPPGHEGYLMSVDNTKASSPLLYASGPARAYPRRQAIEEVDALEDPELRATMRRVLTHPSGVQKLTRVVIAVNERARKAPNARWLNSLEDVAIVSNLTPQILLEFDSGETGTSLTCDGPPRVVVRY